MLVNLFVRVLDGNNLKFLLKAAERSESRSSGGVGSHQPSFRGSAQTMLAVIRARKLVGIRGEGGDRGGKGGGGSSGDKEEGNELLRSRSPDGVVGAPTPEQVVSNLS